MNCKSIMMAGVLAVLMMGGCSKEASSQKYLDAARQAYAKGDDKAAVIELKNALQKSPENRDARALLGKVYTEQGDGASAEKELRKALELGVSREQVAGDLAQALMIQGQHQKVLDEVAALPTTATAQDRAKVLIARGNAYQALRQFAEAKAAYEAARSLAPDSAEIYIGLAGLAANEQRTEEVLPLIDMAISKNPKRTQSWLLKGDWQRIQGNVDAAIAAYQEALKVDPGTVAAHEQLATLYLGQGKVDAARAEVAALQKKQEGKNPSAKYLLALIEFQQKNFTGARDHVQEVLRVAPNHPPSVLLFSATAIALGEFGQAEQQLTPLLAKFPNSPYGRQLLATAQLQLKQPDKALATLQPLLSDEKPSAQALALAGEANMQMKQFTKATEFFERAASVNPENAIVRTELALSRYASGQSDQGLADLTAAAGLESDKGRADILRVMAHINKKEWDQALSAINSLEKKQPDIPLVHNLRGVVYAQKKDNTNARKQFEKALTKDAAYFPAAMNLAQLDMADKQPTAARKRFEAVLAKDQNNLRAMLAIAGLEAEAKREKDMLEWLNKAANAHKTAAQPRILLTRYYLQKNDAPRALTIAREAANANPNQADALDNLGIAQMAAGEKENAVATYSKLAALAPSNPFAHLRLGMAQEAAQNSQAARSAYQKSLELQPELIDAQVGLARLDVQAGRFDEAQKIAQQVQKQHPKRSLGYALEGEVLIANNQAAQAAKQFKTALGLEKNNALVLKLHHALNKAGEAKQADDELKRWLNANPNDAVVRMFHADSLLKAGQFGPASEHYEILLKANPQNLLAMNNLAWVYQQRKDPRAKDMAERALKLAPDNPSIMDTLGWILIEQNQTQRGIQLLQSALSKAPDNPEIRYHLAAGLAKSGDKARARDELERIFKSGIKFSQEREARELLNQLKAAQ